MSLLDELLIGWASLNVFVLCVGLAAPRKRLSQTRARELIRASGWRTRSSLSRDHRQTCQLHARSIAKESYIDVRIVRDR
jgi:hypothetical protein